MHFKSLHFSFISTVYFQSFVLPVVTYCTVRKKYNTVYSWQCTSVTLRSKLIPLVVYNSRAQN